jgi:hypothetical protein
LNAYIVGLADRKANVYFQFVTYTGADDAPYQNKSSIDSDRIIAHRVVSNTISKKEMRALFAFEMMDDYDRVGNAGHLSSQPSATAAIPVAYMCL